MFNLNETTLDKVKGVFYGQAIGDALGLATEFMSKDEAHQTYPDGVSNYNQIIQDKHRSRWKAGNWTDDTDQFLCILESILANGKIAHLDIASRFVEWMNSEGMGIGMTTYSVLTMPQYTEFPYMGSELAWKMKGRDIAPNGALMRNSIVCLYEYWNYESVMSNCDAVAKLTHHDPRCGDTCKIMAHIIINELQGNPLNEQDLIFEIEKHDARIKDYVLPLSKTIAHLNLDDSKSMGYTLKALDAGVWAYLHAEDFESGLQSIIMEGGDADTNGCIVGSILGAKFGYSNIPSSLIEGLNEKEKLESLFQDFIRLIKERLD